MQQAKVFLDQSAQVHHAVVLGVQGYQEVVQRPASGRDRSQALASVRQDALADARWKERIVRYRDTAKDSPRYRFYRIEFSLPFFLSFLSFSYTRITRIN